MQAVYRVVVLEERLLENFIYKLEKKIARIFGPIQTRSNL